MFTPEEWARYEPLIDEAQDLPAGERAAFVRSRISDPAAAEQVLAFLDLTEEDNADVLGERPDDLVEALVEDGFLPTVPGETLQPGDVIDRHRIVDVIGPGGMGMVYLAERSDGQFEQRVALKVIKRGMDTAEIVRRFQHERQILARLQHEHIAGLVDGGMTEDGRPYFVMEYVQGRPLDAYCDSEALTVAERLRLFLQVCEAVQHAHRNLLVHRDLKPGNILVTDDGKVKLLDFGIAKMLAEDGPGDRMLTVAGHRLMTPAYAAPEQINEEPVTTATDVYAMGVILYELLTGHRPYAVHDIGWDELRAVIRHQVPERPSTVVTRPVTEGDDVVSAEAVSQRRGVEVRQLRRQLARDLDAITMRALKKEPDARYASAGDLASDVQRYLDGRTVSARDDTLWYRTSKFVQRYKLAVAAFTLAFLLLVVGVITTTWQAQVARQERDTALATANFIIDLFEASDPDALQGEEFTAVDFVDNALPRLDDLSDQPIVQGRILNVLGRLMVLFNQTGRADSLYRQAWQRFGGRGGAVSVDRADNLFGRGTIALNRGENAEALALFDRAAGQLDATDPAEAIRLPAIRNAQAFVLLRANADSARVLYENTLALIEQLEATYPEQAAFELDKAESLTGLGMALGGRENEAAVQHLETALTLRLELLGRRHSKTAMTMHELGQRLAREEAFVRAETLMVEALAINRTLFPPVHSTIATSLNDLGYFYAGLNRPEEAQPLFREAAEVMRETVPPPNPSPVFPLVGLTEARLKLGDAVGAEAAARQALSVLEEREATATLYAVIRSMLGESLVEQRRFAEAEPFLRESYEVLAAAPNQRGRALRVAGVLQRLYEATDQPARAAEMQAAADSLKASG